MGNYFPVANPATVYYFTAAGSYTGGDPLEFTGTAPGDGQVQRATGSGRYAGIGGSDTAAGQSHAVYVGNATFYGIAEGTVASGDHLAASAVPGHQVKTAAPGDEVIGKAFGSAADGQQVHWIQQLVT
jgi:hypothetical protein